jgi:L-aspartate oxidase
VERHCDYLVLGSGIAGLTYALKLAERFPVQKIVIATKSSAAESNTQFAQGGIAVVADLLQDSFEQHIQDTLIAGDGLCRREVVEMVVREGRERLAELVQWGTKFDLTQDGKFNLHREGGHRYHRIIHHGDSTGQEIQSTLLERIEASPNIELLTRHAAIDLIYEENTCYGAAILDLVQQKVINFRAGITLLATGGLGQVFSYSTNPSIATGDGIAMAIRAGVKTENLEFVQFHPTALYEEGKTSGQVFLISEAVRGFGAKLKNQQDHCFMNSYDERGDLAPRDIVSRAIFQEMKCSGQPHVFLDCAGLDQKDFKRNFPVIHEKCHGQGIDLSKEFIPVVPAAHYSCGGIQSDEWGRSSMKNLLVCGECASTGLHGANRLASNSLLEALVFAHRCFRTTVDAGTPNPVEIKKIPYLLSKKTKNEAQIISLREEIQSLMSHHLGIVCNDEDLLKVKGRLIEIHKENEKIIGFHGLNFASLELRNMVQVSSLIVENSLKQEENKGVFYKTKTKKNPVGKAVNRMVTLT